MSPPVAAQENNKEGRRHDTTTSMTWHRYGIKFCLSAVAASVAETATFPLDITKTRMQIQGEVASGSHKGPRLGMIGTAAGIVQQEGLFSLWRGLPPAVMRHVFYSGSRMGIYEQLRNNVFKRNADVRTIADACMHVCMYVCVCVCVCMCVHLCFFLVKISQYA